MWYVVQTTTGKEQELVDVIGKLLPASLYKECFFLKRQLLKRLGGEWLEVTETLFPAYVFLDLDEKNSKEVFYQLKKIPEFTKLLGDGLGSFIPLDAEEAEFLRLLCQNDEEGPGDGNRGIYWQQGAGGLRRDGRRNNFVPLTRVMLNSDGSVQKLEGPLEYFKEKIIRLNLRKRYAIIEITMRGELQTAMLGVKLERD